MLQIPAKIKSFDPFLRMMEFSQTKTVLKIPSIIENFDPFLRMMGIIVRGGFRGGAESDPSPLRDSTPFRPKGSPFDTFSESPFWLTDPKIFLKAPLAPIYTNFEGKRAPKKNAIFLSTFFVFLTVFSKICRGAKKLAKIGAKQCFGRARKINLVDLNRKSENPPLPSRKS